MQGTFAILLAALRDTQRVHLL